MLENLKNKKKEYLRNKKCYENKTDVFLTFLIMYGRPCIINPPPSTSFIILKEHLMKCEKDERKMPPNRFFILFIYHTH